MKFSAAIAVFIGVLGFTSVQAASNKSAHAHSVKTASHAGKAASSKAVKSAKAKKASVSKKSAAKSAKPGKAALRAAHGKSVKAGKAVKAKKSGKQGKAAKATKAKGKSKKLAGKPQRSVAMAPGVLLEPEVVSQAQAEDLVAEAEAAEYISGAVPYADAINSEEEAAGPTKERVYDGLLPGDGYTITMDSFPDENGSTECVQLIKSLLDAPRTRFWKEGRRLKHHFSNISPGTAIATFVRGQYPQTGRTGMHAAIFVRATQAGIFVLDQFRGRHAVSERFIPWYNPASRKRSNNAFTYSTIRW